KRSDEGVPSWSQSLSIPVGCVRFDKDCRPGLSTKKEPQKNLVPQLGRPSLSMPVGWVRFDKDYRPRLRPRLSTKIIDQDQLALSLTPSASPSQTSGFGRCAACCLGRRRGNCLRRRRGDDQ